MTARCPAARGAPRDFWGYTGDDPLHPDFFSREAPQIAAVMRMVQRLAEPAR
jgi:hypothetical protein